MAATATTTNGAPPSTSGLSRGQLKRLKAKKKATAGPSTVKEEVDDRPLEVRSSSPRLGLRPTALITRSQKPAADSDQVVPKLEEGAEEAKDATFAAVFAKFQLPSEETQEDNKPGETGGKGEIIYSDDELPSEDDEEAAEAVELSKRKQRKISRLSVAELKRIVRKPEVVDWVDVSATDPKLLVQIKSSRNTIPIPPHWSQKRDYLQGKRGIEKAQFQLPSFIADTGIATQQDAVKEKNEGQSLKAKTRERVQPKMGKIDIDYQKLHDAFFKYQTKPKMTEFGELYYEGKEFETKLKEKKPGDLSEDLKEALSIPPLAPPPWLISMQRYGPPPSYPNLRVPGLNAPIPEGAAWGFHPGGWGKPPVDEYNRPLYGDVYGISQNQDAADVSSPVFPLSIDGTDDPSLAGQLGEPIVVEPWGELEPDEEGDLLSLSYRNVYSPSHEHRTESEEEEDSDEESDDEEAPAEGLQTPSTGLETPSGFASVASTVPAGIETPDFLDLRKRREATEAEDEGPKSLYQVLPEREARMRGVMGSDRVYDVSGITAPPVLGQEERGTKRKARGVEIALDAAELEGLSEAELRQRFEAEGRSRGTHEDFSSYVSEEVAKRRKTAEAKKRGDAGSKEKFKF